MGRRRACPPPACCGCCCASSAASCSRHRAYGAVGLSIVFEAVGPARRRHRARRARGRRHRRVPRHASSLAMAATRRSRRSCSAAGSDRADRPARARTRCARSRAGRAADRGAAAGGGAAERRRDHGQARADRLGAGVYAAAVGRGQGAWSGSRSGSGSASLPEATRRAAAGVDPRPVLLRALGVIARSRGARSPSSRSCPSRCCGRVRRGVRAGADVLLMLGAGDALLAVIYARRAVPARLHHRWFVSALALVAIAEPVLLAGAPTWGRSRGPCSPCRRPARC